MKKVFLFIQRWFFRLGLIFMVGSLGLVLLYRFVPVIITPLMVQRSVESLWGDRWVGINKDWVPLEEISPSILRAVLKAEDYRFFEHNGFDFEAIQKAMIYNKTHPGKKKGASTISQQTAKNVFLWPRRDWLRKGLEAYFTVLIEFTWPKERIMEVYLNVIELGPGVYGVEAASQKYFKRSAKSVNSHQASLIAAVLPNPRRYRIEKPSIYVMARQRRILRRVSPEMPKENNTPLFDFLDLKFDSEDDVN
ncbi:monofunctional biosynthetic peptidoglycan transglycosylase [Bdellovibrio bacteriovorus]|uniref:Biosynthetic peptidoglycan transglycosylase n=1 Tax=Bdellovibrio bacteriovorus TaxID=959 RepID=A0A150WN94_BDEBC|nr:monofunctional biosynthetic peptidoglycan transglycosylase [Bdellovibrio bacteriovorus]KYG65777.1 monofunctional biosynthetic peptidoglycan transglycosylase [Bdellovibrio bacteriovorus]